MPADTDPTASESSTTSDEPKVVPYVPFPSFSDWTPQTFDTQVFDRFSDDLRLFAAETNESTLSKAVEVATKWAAANTGAIEGLYEVDRGFTYTVAVSGAAWSNLHLAKGQLAAQSMQDALTAYDFVLDATTNKWPVTEVWIRQLHEIVCASQETFTVITTEGLQERALLKGTYKTDPNSPLNLSSNTIHSYAPPMDTAFEMTRLVEELRKPAFEAAHPVLQASYAHYAFVCVHPFADGNGRVSRALASAFLYRSPGVPLVIFADQKAEYIDALESADADDYLPFIRFVSERVIDTVGMVKAQMKMSGPGIDEHLDDMASALVGLGGLQHTEVDAISQRLLELFVDAVTQQLSESPLPNPLAANMQKIGGSFVAPPTGYRSVPSNPVSLQLSINSPSPASANQSEIFETVIAKPNTAQPDFMVLSRSGSRILEASLREMHPTVGAALTYRARIAAMAAYRDLLGTTNEVAKQSLRNNGYL
nr:Fic family protein [Clavibacter michiganensis]